MIFFLVALLLGQTLTAILQPATPFQVTWDQPPNDGALAVNYRFWCDGGIVKNFALSEAIATVPSNADGTTTYTATVPGLPAGLHSCLVSAYNSVGEVKGVAVPVTVGTLNALPATPLRLKIVVTVGGG